MSDQEVSAGTAVTWGVVGEHAVFAEEPLVDDLIRVRGAIENAGTWGEFRAAVPPRYDEEIREMFREMLEDEEAPADDEKFDADVIPGYSDGDWPEWLHQVMLAWMPADLIERYGSVEESVFNGKMLVIDHAAGGELARELEERGFACVQDDRAVAAAAGWA